MPEHPEQGAHHHLFTHPQRGASGGMRSRKLMVGRGPRDQSSGQKPRARAPEALACLAPLRFERARRREVGSGRIAAFTTGLPSETIFRGRSEVCFSSRAQSSRWSLFQKKRGVVTFWILPP